LLYFRRSLFSESVKQLKLSWKMISWGSVKRKRVCHSEARK
jgi:hypothetical protein